MSIEKWLRNGPKKHKVPAIKGEGAQKASFISNKWTGFSTDGTNERVGSEKLKKNNCRKKRRKLQGIKNSYKTVENPSR